MKKNCFGITRYNLFEQWNVRTIFKNDILFPKLFCPTLRKNRSNDQKNSKHKTENLQNKNNLKRKTSNLLLEVFSFKNCSDVPWETSPKGFSAFKCDVGNWIFKNLGIFWDFFLGGGGDFLGILWEFYRNSLAILWQLFGNSLENLSEFFGNSIKILYEFFGSSWIFEYERNCIDVFVKILE